MTAEQSFKIVEILEPAVGKTQAQAFTKQIEGAIEMKGSLLEDKIDNLKAELIKVDVKLDKLDSRLWTFFVTMVLLILGLYATILLKK